MNVNGSEQYWVEFREATDNDIAFWAVASRTGDGMPVDVSAHRSEAEAAQACAERNAVVLAARAERMEAAYQQGVKRAAGTGRLTQRVNGVFAAAKAAGLDIQPATGPNAFRPR